MTATTDRVTIGVWKFYEGRNLLKIRSNFSKIHKLTPFIFTKNINVISMENKNIFVRTIMQFLVYFGYFS